MTDDRSDAGRGESLEAFIERESARRKARVDPMLHVDGAPVGHHLSGVSTQRKVTLPDGSTVIQWVKTRADQVDPEMVLDAFRYALHETPPPVRPLVAPAAHHNADLITVYPMGDPHLGMLSWHRETGQDFDLAIAERNLCAAVDYLVASAPASETALIINLGDFFHTDNYEAVTSRSGHHLDADGRWPKILAVGIATMCRVIDRALEKHKHVRVINEIGNHDDKGAIMLSACLEYAYRDNPRVEIDTSPSPFHWLEFGKNLIGVHHGHLVKAGDLPLLMAHDMPEAWGRTKFRYIYCGHVHHESKKEKGGVIVESVRTMAPRDAYAHGGGWRSGQSMFCDVLHKNHGRGMRVEFDVSMLAAT